MKINKKYFAFISYSHKDSELAKWLQHEFEYYKLPATLFEERKDLRKEDLPESFRPVFRDEDELAGGELKPQISEALASSEYLIVVCSPNSAQSNYVDSEIKEFISLSPENKRRIFPFIIDGEPHQDKGHKANECFPPTILKLSKDKTEPIELIAGDVKATGRDHAFVKILAGTLKEKDIRFADLWDRYAVYKAEEERKQREQRDKLLIAQSRFLAEKANDLVEEGDSYTARLLALEALPKDLENPDRPYVTEAEIALRRALQSNTAIYKGHTDKVTSISLSPDGRVIASASFDGTIRLLDITTGQTMRELPIKKEALLAVSFSPNGQCIAYVYAVEKDYSIHIWNLNKNCHQCVLRGHQGVVRSISFSHDGLSLITASNDGTIRVWDIVKEKCINVLRDNDIFALSAAFSPNKNYIATSSYDKYVRIWNTVSGQLIHKLEGHTDVVTNVVFSSDGSMLASTSEDFTIRIWDTATWQCKRCLKGHQRFVLSAAFSPDNLILASGSSDNSIRLWEMVEGRCVGVLKGHVDRVNSVVFHQEGNLVISSSDDSTVRIWELFNDDCKSVSLSDVSIFRSSSLNSKGNLCVEVDGYRDICVKEDSGCVLREGIGHTDDVSDVCFSPDDRFIASASYDKTIRIWNTDTLECIHVLKGHATAVMSVSFSPDGQCVVSTSLDDTIRVWDVSTGHCLLVIDNKFTSASCFTSDGSHIISNFSDNYADMWEFSPIQCLIEENRKRFENRQLTPDERKKYYLD